MRSDAARSAELAVRVQPRARQNEIVGWREGRLALRVTAPPVENAANEACRELLARWLGVRRADVELVAGATSREKRFRIVGLEPETLAERLRARLAGAPPPDAG